MKSVGLTRGYQEEAFEDLREAVAQRDDVEADQITDGDVVTAAAGAYCGYDYFPEDRP